MQIMFIIIIWNIFLLITTPRKYISAILFRDKTLGILAWGYNAIGIVFLTLDLLGI